MSARILLAISFLCHAQQQDLQLVGDATRTGTLIQLTPLLPDQTGAVWLKLPLLLTPTFETEFTFRITKGRTRTADGFAFVIQNLGPNAIGGRGSSGGFSIGRGSNPPDRGIPRSLAVFFDTHRNVEEGDPSGNSIGLYTNSDGYFLPRRLAILNNAPVRLASGLPQKVLIRYTHPKFEVSLNGATILTSNVSLEAIIGSSGKGYVGFTASTGSGFELHDILDWRFQSNTSQIGFESVSSILRFHDTSCLPGRTLCTPAEPVIEQSASNRWHIILPAHLPGSVRIPNPTQAKPKITSASGTICWSQASKKGYTCNGPDGDPSGKGKLTHNNRDGHLIFSTTASATDHKRNEGYFEFDVELPSS